MTAQTLTFPHVENMVVLNADASDKVLEAVLANEQGGEAQVLHYES